MKHGSPEISRSQNITTLRKTVNEELASASEITLRADNVGAQKWAEMLSLMQETRKEARMDVFFNKITRKFIPGSIIIGEERGSKKGPDSPIEFSDVDGLNKLFCDRVVSTHTHPMRPEEAQMKTSVPSGNDLIKFLIGTEGAMIIIDRGGAHLLIKTREFIAKDPSVERKTTTRRPLQADSLARESFEGENLPPPDLVQNKIDEVKEKDGIIADVQAELNTMFSPYGVRYLFCPAADIPTSKEGTITFKTFSRADAKREKEILDALSNTLPVVND